MRTYLANLIMFPAILFIQLATRFDAGVVIEFFDNFSAFLMAEIEKAKIDASNH